MLDKFFKLSDHNTSVKQEIIAGTSTFLAMAYIIVVNPQILSNTGMDYGAVFVATCLAAAIGSLLMGLLANYPIALAPGMGLNAFFTFGVVLGMGYSWQVALGCIFWSGIIFFLLSIFKARKWIIESIPRSLKYAISIGIGLFLAMIALQNAGVIVNNDATLVGLGNIKSAEVLLTFLGFFIISTLYIRKINGAIIIGILSVTIIAFLIGKIPYQGLVSLPPSIAPTFLQLEFSAILDLALLPIIFAFLFVDLFDTSGTLIAVADKAELLDENSQLKNIDQALLADSTATVTGSLFGTSSTTSYIESAAGVVSGGRTGLTAVTTAILFLIALFLSPLAAMIPPYATAPALLFVAVLMMGPIIKISWDDISEAAPALITAIMMPLTFSIAEGIALGFISYTLIKIFTGKLKDLNVSIYVIAGLFILKYIFLV
jgi:AGZA family xanthine/uracil permease-like MFS transporter